MIGETGRLFQLDALCGKCGKSRGDHKLDGSCPEPAPNKLPVFEIRDGKGKHFKIWADGRTEGFENVEPRMIINRMSWYGYHHMCRDDHVQIGHNDSSDELCPLCLMRNERDMWKERAEQLDAIAACAMRDERAEWVAQYTELQRKIAEAEKT